MLTLIMISLSLHRQNIPMPIVQYLKNNNINTIPLDNKDVSWEKTNNCKNIIDKYFYKMNKNNYENKNCYGEIFKIFGYPATIVIINNKFKYVEEFIINKNLILMFDAGPLMRWTFYKNLKKINIKNSLNKNIFLII